MKTILGLSFIILALGACSTKNTMYYWGHYEPLIYESYRNPGKIPPEQQIEKLQEDKQKALSKNKRMPPGFHAYLGTLYFQTQKLFEAQHEFEIEKTEYPESAVFMDRLIDNAKGKTK